MIDHRKSILIARIGRRFLLSLFFLGKFIKDLYKELLDLMETDEMKELLPSDNLKV